MRRSGAWLLTGLIGMALAGEGIAYPVDGYQDTGIRRLDYVRRVESGDRSQGLS